MSNLLNAKHFIRRCIAFDIAIFGTNLFFQHINSTHPYFQLIPTTISPLHKNNFNGTTDHQYQEQTQQKQVECPFQFADNIDCELGAKMISSNTGQMGTQQKREQKNRIHRTPQNNIISVLKLFALVNIKWRWRTNFPNSSVMYYLHICEEFCMRKQQIFACPKNSVCPFCVFYVVFNFC